MDSRKILHLVEYFELGGIERLLEQLSKGSDSCAELLFFSYETEKLSGIGKSLSDRGVKVFHQKKKQGYDFKLLSNLIRLIKKEKIEVIHTHDFGPMEYAVAVKALVPSIKLIHTQHTLHHFVVNKKYTAFFQFASLFYNKIICVSNFVKSQLTHFCPLSKRKLIVISNGVDTNYFKTANEIKNPESKKLNIVSISRISKEKNLGFTLRALRILNNNNIDFLFHHAGSGSKEAEEHLRSDIKKLGLENHVILYGFQNDCREVLKKGSVFLTSSITEGHPVSVLEAMALKKICVCSDIKPHREIDSNEFILFDLGNPENLARKLIDVKKNLLLLNKRSLYNRQYVEEKFSLSLMVKKYTELYT